LAQQQIPTVRDEVPIRTRDSSYSICIRFSLLLCCLLSIQFDYRTTLIESNRIANRRQIQKEIARLAALARAARMTLLFDLFVYIFAID
jgi:hypothetical protein